MSSVDGNKNNSRETKMRNIVLLLFFLFNLVLYSNEKEIKKFINFDHKSEKGETLNPEEFSGHNELKRWANYQSLYLKPDSPKYGLKDGICRMIPVEGLEFYLTFDPNDKRILYLYFDLTTYENINKSKQPVRVLNIIINGKQKGKAIFDPKEISVNPLRIKIDPTEAPEGRINILLQPDATANGRFWGIWDVFYSYSKE